MDEGRPTTARRVLYAAVLGAVALFGLLTIVDWARRGNELAGGGVPVTGRVIAEEPGFAGALALVEVAYDAGGRERRARLPVPGSNEHPNEPTYRPGDTIALMVARDDPDRVRHAGWDADAAPTHVPLGLVGLAVGAVALPLLLPGSRRRLQETLDSFRRS